MTSALCFVLEHDPYLLVALGAGLLTKTKTCMHINRYAVSPGED